jgi:hypothetical protein
LEKEKPVAALATGRSLRLKIAILLLTSAPIIVYDDHAGLFAFCCRLFFGDAACPSVDSFLSALPFNYRQLIGLFCS